MSDDMRLVPLDDDAELPEAVDAAAEGIAASVAPIVAAPASESRDWDDQGFDANNYDERPPHWED
jgi:hypothetical protein